MSKDIFPLIFFVLGDAGLWIIFAFLVAVGVGIFREYIWIRPPVVQWIKTGLIMLFLYSLCGGAAIWLLLIMIGDFSK